MDKEVEQLLLQIQARARDEFVNSANLRRDEVAADFNRRGMLRSGPFLKAVSDAFQGCVRDEIERLTKELPEFLDEVFGEPPRDVFSTMIDMIVGVIDSRCAGLNAMMKDVQQLYHIPVPLPEWDYSGLVLDLKRNLRIRLGPKELRARLRTIVAPALPTNADKPYDLFISHATEDKKDVVEPLLKSLEDRGLIAWYDRTAVTMGDRLFSTIDVGLRQSRHAVVVLSPAYFSKGWTRAELNALAAMQADEETALILPVWHNVKKEDVRNYSPMLSAVLGVSSALGIEGVADEIARAIKKDADRTVTPLVDAEPLLTYEVAGGRVAMLTVRNAGPAFDLVARARILAASLPIEREAPYQFLPRTVEGIDGLSTYTIATVNTTSPPGVSVKIRGEFFNGDTEVIQYWHQRDGAIKDITFEIEWTLLQRRQADLRPIATFIASLVFDAATGRLSCTQLISNPSAA